MVTGTTDDGHTYSIEPFCGVIDGAECFSPHGCEGPPPGQWYLIIQDGTTPIGRVCLTTDQATDLDGFNETMILRAWRRLDWPPSELVIQPPHGETLVNFDTNFYTPDHRSIDRPVTLAGQAITIRAVPVSYDWYFGDDTSTTTTSPGSPHPDLEITHQYARTGDVVVRVDTTYAGEYRIGDGEWTAIGETLTVEGEDQDLEIVEALPQLVLE